MKKLSVAIITFNEENNLPRALKSVDFANEVIVVDSFSTDKTVEIAKESGAVVSQREFPGHVDQKNHALSLTTHDWVLSIDADEAVTDELKAEIVELLKRDDLKAGYKMPRKCFYLGKWIIHSGWYPDYNIRFVDKTRAKWGGTDPHDKLMLEGETGTLKGDLLHYPYNDLAHHFTTINKYTSIAADRLFKKGKKAGIADITIRPFLIFFKKFILKLGFLDGLQGFVISASTMWYTFCKYLKLYSLHKKHYSE